MQRFVILASVMVLAAASANCGSNSEKSVLGPSSLSGSDAVSANGKGGGKPGGGGTTTGGGSLSVVMVTDNNGNGQPNWNDHITFNVTTTATSPSVRLDCYQGSSWVYVATVGYFPSYPWPKEFTLASTAWTSGAANCTATLYTSVDGTKTTTLATLPIAVAE